MKMIGESQYRNKPSMSLGAETMSDWAVYRIAGDTLNKLAE